MPYLSGNRLEMEVHLIGVYHLRNDHSDSHRFFQERFTGLLHPKRYHSRLDPLSTPAEYLQAFARDRK
jgi:hypothetical protein